MPEHAARDAELSRIENRTGEHSNREEVQTFLENFAQHLTQGDAREIAAMWETPAFVVDDRDVRVIQSPTEVETFFAGAKDQYNASGIVDTRPEILRLEWLTQKVATVEVRWPYIDASGCERGAERSTYTLRRDASGTLKLRIVVMQGVDAQH